MPPKRPIRAVLKESSNNNDNSNVSKKSQTQKSIPISTSTRKKTDENQWRTHILAFYMYDKSLSSYIETNKVGRDPFQTRWEKSGLREFKKKIHHTLILKFSMIFGSVNGEDILLKQNRTIDRKDI
jgi:hypothetical protein